MTELLTDAFYIIKENTVRALYTAPLVLFFYNWFRDADIRKQFMFYLIFLSFYKISLGNQQKTKILKLI